MIMKKVDWKLPDCLKNVKPKEKTEEEKKLYDASEAYYEKFGENYGVSVGMYMPTIDEMLEDIADCLESGERSKKIWMNPKYEPGKKY